MTERLVIRIKRKWDGEKLFPLSRLVKQPDFPLERGYNSIYRWCVYGAAAHRRILVEFPHVIVCGQKQSSVPAARDFIAEMAKRNRPTTRGKSRPYRIRKKANKAGKTPESDGRMRRVN